MCIDHSECEPNTFEKRYNKDSKVAVTDLEVWKPSTSVNARKSILTYQGCSSGGSYLA